MGRPHVEFLFAQTLVWREAPRLPGRPRVRFKILSEDAASGAMAAIVRYPAGFAARCASPYDEELFVLDGALHLDGERLNRDGYAAIGAGREIGWHSPEGAVALHWLDDAGAFQPLVFTVLDTLEMPWDDSFSGKDGFPHPRRKILREDGQAWRTFLLAGKPQNHPTDWTEADLTHPCVEEYFMLGGDMSGPQGVLTAGAYFWRPPHVPHGPFGSRTGSFGIFRFLDGEHINIWGEKRFPFRYDRPYAPILPDDIEPAARDGYRGADRY